MFLVFLQRAIRFSTIFLFGSTGETLTEKSGNLNLGTPGIMCMGGAGGIIGAELYLSIVGGAENITAAGSILMPLIMALVMSCLGGLIYSFITITLRCNQNVTGLALTTFGIGLLSFCGGRAHTAGFTDVSIYFTQSFPISGELNWFETLFLSYGMLVYIAFFIAIIAAIVIKKTRGGLNLRAVGENPATADAAGISVTNYKYAATLIGSMIAGLGGLFYIMDYLGGNVEYNIDQYGWMAVALVIFTVWRPNWAILGSILVTIAVLVVTSIISRRESQPPASLGVTYFREER